VVSWSDNIPKAVANGIYQPLQLLQINPHPEAFTDVSPSKMLVNEDPAAPPAIEES
jgi:hypothetical protein